MTSPLPAPPAKMRAAFFPAAFRRAFLISRVAFSLLILGAAQSAHAQTLAPTQSKFTGKTASMVFDWSARADALCNKAQNSVCDANKMIRGAGFLPPHSSWAQTNPDTGFKRAWNSDTSFLFNPKTAEELRARYYIQVYEVGDPAWRPNNARNYLPAGVAVEGNVVGFNDDLPVVFKRGTTDAAWSVAGTSVTFTGLIAGKTYRARVRAVNPKAHATVSEWANANPVRTNIDLPGRPTEFSTLSLDGKIVLTWTAPSSGGPVFSYRYRWSNDGTHTTWENAGGATGVFFAAPAGDQLRHTIEGVENGKLHVLQLDTFNPKGVGGWSNEVVATATPRAFTLDVDNSGGAASGTDGIMIARYLAGVRGEKLSDGLGLSSGAAEIAGIGLGDNASQLDVDGSGEVTVHDGVLIARYLIGIRAGAQLTAKISEANVDTVIANIVALGAPSPP